MIKRGVHMAKIGYARVSTEDQSLELQIDALEKEGCEQIFQDKMSGRTTNRPQFNECLKYLRTGDTLVVYKLDRLGRTTKQLINLVSELQEKEIYVQSINDPFDTSSPQGKVFFTIMSAFAEMQVDLIRERTKAGLESARARGRTGGRPFLKKETVDHALALYETKKYSASEVAEMTGISKSKLFKERKKRREQSKLKE